MSPTAQPPFLSEFSKEGVMIFLQLGMKNLIVKFGADKDGQAVEMFWGAGWIWGGGGYLGCCR